MYKDNYNNQIISNSKIIIDLSSELSHPFRMLSFPIIYYVFCIKNYVFLPCTFYRHIP